ncbi:MAG: carbonic anhydrase [Legionellales bacterium]|nr:carbonic anhydrase [Legionellales bacterium]
MLKKYALYIFILIASVNLNALANVITVEQQQALTPQQVLTQLMNGNEKFVKDELDKKDHSLILKHNAQGQYPFAFIFNCVDSRSVPELLFDQVPGNIFVGRIAGNVVSNDVLGSMEFATQVAGAKLIVVMGHTQCGAVAGACNNVELGNLTGLLSKIKPAVTIVKDQEKNNFNCKSLSTIDAIAKQNVLEQMNYIVKNSEIIANLINEKKIILVGAMHDIKSGKVSFFDIQGKALS